MLPSALKLAEYVFEILLLDSNLGSDLDFNIELDIFSNSNSDSEISNI